MSTRDNFFAACRRRYDTTEIPGFGSVRMRSLSELERAKLEIAAQANPTEFNARLIIATIVDEDGDPIFAEGDLEHLLELDARISAAVVAAVTAHCGQDSTPTEAALKNSEETLVGGLP